MAIHLQAQQASPVRPAADSPDLYLSFFFFQEDFAKWTRARTAAEPLRQTQILASSAKYLGISPDDFAIVESVSASVTAGLRAIGAESQAFVASEMKATGRVDPGGVAVFYNRRQSVIQAGVDQLKGSLSAESWQRLLSYINNQHRQHVTIPSSATQPVK